MNFAQKILRIERQRGLTTAEMALAFSVFGTQLNTARVQLVACRWILRGYAMSPNGHVYFHPDDWREDFAQADLNIQSWLIHELVHVWQVQQGIAVLRRAVFDRRYRYQLVQGKPFLAYGIEQQAQIVQDYFVRREKGQECAAWEACLPFSVNLKF
ncbi:MAG: type IV secretion protein Rhs [Moraxellaceae bacterium]